MSFEEAHFDRFADFKYTQFSEPLNMNGVEFDGDSDFKYATVNGRSFVNYLMKSKWD